MLELTEQSIATDPKRLVRRLTELRELGIQIALDDFGAATRSSPSSRITRLTP